MSNLGAIVEQTQKLINRDFFLAAYLPTAITALALWTVTAGLVPVVETLGALPGEALPEVVVATGLAVVILYLVAYIVHGLRRSLRQLWSGHVPPRRLREELVTIRRTQWRRMDDRREGFAEQRTAFHWATGGFATNSIGFVPPPKRPVGTVDLQREATKRCRDLDALRRRWVAFPVGRAIATVDGLWRLAPHHGESADIRCALEKAAQAWSSERFEQRIRAARLRVEQRFNAADEQMEQGYPPEDAMQGTVMGNVLARAEHYSTHRYAIPLTELWPRLRLVASEDALAVVDDALVRLDFAVALATGGLVVAVIGIAEILLAEFEPQRAWITLGAVVISMAMYRFAIASAQLYGRSVAAVVDLFINELGSKLPENFGDLNRDWDSIRHFFARGDPLM